MTDHAEPTSLADVQPGQRFCGVRQAVIDQARAQTFAWRNKRRLAWCIADRLPGVPLDQLTLIFGEAWAAWQRVCGLVFYQVGDPNAADLVILTRPIDGASGTLAEHELPPGDDRRLRGWFDVGERWHVGLDAPPANRIDLLAVATHEFGHGIGVSHEETRGTVALMDPYYNPQVRKPQAWDIAEVQRRYGPPVEEPKPVEPGQPPAPGGAPAEFPLVINAFGAVYAATAVKKLG